jgi:signal transduction histidine kinase
MAGVFPGRIDPRALPELTHHAHSAHRVAAVVAGTFVLVGLTWAFLTDVLLYSVSHDRVFMARVQTAKDWTFIGLAGLLIYGITFLGAARLDRVRRLTAAMVESIGDGVLLLGHDRAIAYANPAAARMLGCTREELVGMTAATFSFRFRVSYPSGGMVPPGRLASQRVFDEGGPVHYKAVLHPGGGGDVVIRSMASGVRMEVGAPATWVVSVMHDITDTEHLEHIRDQFFAAAAHSLKTPLAIIKADVQALHPDGPPDHGPGVASRITESIIRQCDRMDRLVQNLLVLARAREKALELHPSELALRPLIERISGEHVWSYRHIVQTDVTGSPSLHADPERIALAIRNLMYEACRLSPADSCLTLLARPEGNQVAVGIRYQPVPWRDQAEKGYGEYDDIGIGRSVAQTIVAEHGGSFSEETSESERTSWIHLPTDAGTHA